MNKIVTKFALLLLALMLNVGQLHAQFTTTFAKNATPGQQNGLYYSLPQTVLRIDFVIRETVSEKGPLSDYADVYFGNEDYVDYHDTSFELLDVSMSSEASPDPNATFFVTFSTVRGAGKTLFDVLPNGIIRCVGTRNPKVVEGTAECVEKQEKDCKAETVGFDQDLSFMSLLKSGKSNAQLAKEVADKIEEIRKAKFYLISGDVEMASNPETFHAMYQKLDVMEKEYTSLFLGKHSSRKVVKSLYVIPNKDFTTQTLAKFSRTDGLTMGTEGSGRVISVQTLSLNTTSAINAPSQSAVESMSYDNSVFYRVPETANVKVMLDDEVLIEDRLIVNQLGALLMAPIGNSKLVFDTETGQILNMRMQ